MLTIIQLNCRGYYNNRHLIQEIIRNKNPDIVLLNNTGTPPTPIKYYGYTTTYTRDTQYDGVAIMVKSVLKHTFRTEWQNPHFLAVDITTIHGKMIIATTYARPNRGIPGASMLTLFNNTNIPVYLIADLNSSHASFGHASANPHGHYMNHLMHTKNLRFLGPDFPTCFNHRGKGRPDLIFANRQTIQFNHHISAGPPCGSDHIPIIVKISTNPISVPARPHLDYKNTDWEQFKESLSE